MSEFVHQGVAQIQRRRTARKGAVVDDDAVLRIGFRICIGERAVSGDVGKRQLAGVDVDESGGIDGKFGLHSYPFRSGRKATTREVRGVGIPAHLGDVEMQSRRVVGIVEHGELLTQNGFAQVSFERRAAEDVKHQVDL